MPGADTSAAGAAWLPTAGADPSGTVPAWRFMFVPQSWSISTGYFIYSLNSSDQRHIFGVPKPTAVWESFVTYLERIQRETLDATEASCLDGREGPSPGIYQ